MPTITLIRHAQASFGARDYDLLSDLGRQQADVLAGVFELRGSPDRIISGSHRRHVETAAALASASGSPTVVDPRWDEYDVNEILTHHGASAAGIDRGGGDAREVLSPREFQGALAGALAEWIAQDEASGSAQTWSRFSAGRVSALEALAAELAPGETASVFTSAGVIAAISSSLLGLSGKGFIELNRVAVNTGVTKVVSGAAGLSLISFNDHSHLEAVDRSLVTYQ